jgi:hypothetical protein
MHGVTYQRLGAVSNQAQEAANFLGTEYAERNQFLVAINALLDDLVFDPLRTEEFESAFDRLATHLGLRGQRPERETGNGPDVLWSVGARAYLIIECKSGSGASEIARRDVEQLGHSITWFEQEYHGSRFEALLVHPATRTAPNAVAPPRARVMTRAHLAELRTAAQRFSVALADGQRWREREAVAEQLRVQHLVGSDVADHFSVPVRPGRRR